MPKSMTGYGRGEYLEEGLRITIEIRAVNHKYNEINLRSPRFLIGLEDRLRRTVARELSRGKIDVFVNWQDTSSAQKGVAINQALAAKYFGALLELKEQLPDAAFNVGIHQLALYPDVLQLDSAQLDEDSAWQKLSVALNEALSKIAEMRLKEGENLAADVYARIDCLENYVGQLVERAPQIATEHRERLMNKMREMLLDLNCASDETRVMQEAALFAERTNFAEELTRLSSHIKQLRSTLKSNAPIGKKLDFLIQEVNREVNTTGSKCNDFEAASIVVELKSELDKIREQIQNIE